MRKIAYPDPVKMAVLLKEYENIFSLDNTTMQNKWINYRDKLRRLSTNLSPNVLYPDNITDVFTMPYPTLVEMYLDYVQIQGTGKYKNEEVLHENLSKLFHYSGQKNPFVSAYQRIIAKFFMQHSGDLGISVCYYCETSFINTYGFTSIYKNLATFLVAADIDTFKRYIRKSDDNPYCNAIIKDIYNLCHGADITTVVGKFDNYRYFKNMDPKKSECVKERLRNHFDLDHFLPQSICPLVALSFYNFVPSCSVCNEKLKGADMIGETDKSKLLVLSPTSDIYNFDKDIKIGIVYNAGVSTLRMQEHPDDFRLEFTPKGSEYQTIVNEFRLDERYNYHKQIALKQYDLYQDFSPGHISQLEKLFGGAKKRNEIENQIFRGEYTEDNARCFDKLKRDIKEQSGR